MRLRGRAAGGAPRRTAAAQRLHLAAEGHRPGRRGRRLRRGVRGARLHGNYNFNYTPYVVVAVFFVVLTVPLARFTDWLRGATPSASGRVRCEPRRCSRCATCASATATTWCSPTSTSCRRAARRGVPDRLVGLGQVDAAALPEPARGHRRRRDRFEGREISDPRVDPRDGAQPDGHGVPGLQPLPAPERARQLHARAAARARAVARRGRGAGPRAAGAVRARGPRRQAPRPALRRPAAARRPGARAVHAAPRCCCSTRSPPPSTPSWSARCSASCATWPTRGHHDGAGHPRDGLRPRRRHQGLLPRPGPDPRAGPARRRSSPHPREERTRQFLRRVLPAGPA